MSRSIIRYVPGFPLEEMSFSKDFLEFREKYWLKEENADVHSYTGSLTSKDFKVVREVFCSSQFYDLRGNFLEFINQLERAIDGEMILTKRHGESTWGEPMKYFETPIKGVNEASENLITVLREIERKDISIRCANDVNNFIKNHARELGQYKTISFSYPFGACPDDFEAFKLDDLYYNKRALIFVDEKLVGDIRLEKTKEYNDQRAGWTEEGIATSTIANNSVTTNWNSWQTNHIRWVADAKIRKELLNEKERDKFFIRL